MGNGAKKVLYAASTAGHLENFHKAYILQLAQQGYQVVTCCKGRPELEGACRHIEFPLEKKLYSPRNFALSIKLARDIVRERYDLISVHTSLAAFFVRMAVMLAGKRGARVVNTVHGYLFDENSGAVKRRLMLAAEKLTARVTDTVITMNAWDASLAERERLAPQVLFTDGMGVDFTRFSIKSRHEARERLGLSESSFVLLCAAEFSERKNQAMLIDAMDMLPDDTVLVLAGRGDELERCRAQAAHLGDRVRFMGYVEDMSECWAAADVCVSASRFEGLPYNVMEAMYFALPTAASNVKGHTDLIRDGINGLLYPFGDAAAFAGKVGQLMDDRRLCRTMGAAAKQGIEKYSLEQVQPRLTEMLTGERSGITV